MVARKRNRSSLRLSILERHTQRRLQSIKATTGCQIFVVEKETAINRISDENIPSITIINSERFLKPDEIDALPQQSQLLHLVDLPPNVDPLDFLSHRHQFDSTVLMRDSDMDASTFVQSLLYGLSQQVSSLVAIPFTRWGAARKVWDDLSQKYWLNEVLDFSAELDLAPEISRRQSQFLHILNKFVSPEDSRGHLVMAADGCNVIMKIRCRLRTPEKLIPRILELPILAAGFCQRGEDTELMLIQRQRLHMPLRDGVEIFLLYSPRDVVESPSLEEAG